MDRATKRSCGISLLPDFLRTPERLAVPGYEGYQLWSSLASCSSVGLERLAAGRRQPAARAVAAVLPAPRNRRGLVGVSRAGFLLFSAGVCSEFERAIGALTLSTQPLSVRPVHRSPPCHGAGSPIRRSLPEPGGRIRTHSPLLLSTSPVDVPGSLDPRSVKWRGDHFCPFFVPSRVASSFRDLQFKRVSILFWTK